MENLKRNIKSTTFIWSLILLLLVGGIIYCSDTIVQADTTVLVTATGSKYHVEKCGNGTYYESTLSAALSRGLTACSKCFDGGSYSDDSYYSDDYSYDYSYDYNDDSDYTKPKDKKVKPIKINKTSIMLLTGQSSKLKISNATEKVKWKSTKKSVATVSSSGKVIAKKKGKTVIIAKVGKQQKKCTVKVEDPKLNLSKVSMTIGESKTLKFSGCKHSIKWSSDDPSIVKVSKGKIKARDIGKTKVRVTVHGKKFTCRVTIKGES